MKERRSPLAWLICNGIRIYWVTLSPIIGRHCRFDPTCSRYAYQAIQTHGGLVGGWLALKRMGRCHPLGGCGHDPVPQCEDD